MKQPEVIQKGLLDMQVCVPKHFTDDEVIAFAEKDNPCGTTGGWFIRKKGSERLKGLPERNPCEQREGCVHIIVEA